MLNILFSEDEYQARYRRSTFVPYKTGREVAAKVSNALDELLLFSGYDKQIRPGVRKEQFHK